MNEFIPLYILLLEFAGGDIQVAKMKDQKFGQMLVANEGNQHLLRDIGQELLDDGTIIGYQIAKTFEAPTKTY